MEIDAFFRGDDAAFAIHQAVQGAVERLGAAEVRVSKGQIGFYRRRPFAATWRPDQYLGPGQAPLVLSVYLRRRDDGPRWKEIVEPAPGRFTHHVELWSAQDVDAFIESRLAEAWAEAG